MARAFSVELSRRSLFFAAGRIELMAEWRDAEWPKQWTSLVEPGTRELWLGRIYICMARVGAGFSAGPALPAAVPEDGAARPCQILAFKAPARAV